MSLATPFLLDIEQVAVFLGYVALTLVWSVLLVIKIGWKPLAVVLAAVLIAAYAIALVAVLGVWVWGPLVFAMFAAIKAGPLIGVPAIIGSFLHAAGFYSRKTKGAGIFDTTIDIVYSTLDKLDFDYDAFADARIGPHDAK